MIPSHVFRPQLGVKVLVDQVVSGPKEQIEESGVAVRDDMASWLYHVVPKP